MHPYHSPQELIAKRQLNQSDGSAKDYVYLWDKSQQNNTTQAMYPRSVLTQYCHEQGGKLSLLYKSQLSSVRDSAQRKRLSSNRGVTQGIGAYQCSMNDLTESWIVSIEPISERQIDSGKSRSVRLLTRVMSATEARNFYRPSKAAVTEDKAKKNAAAVKAAATTKAANSKTADAKELARKEQDKKDKELERKELEKKEVEKKELKAAVETPRTSAVETPQQQQMKLYAAARRDINSGRNLLNACNNAQRAYNYGKLQGAEGTRIYTESGMLVAKCLTSVSVYSNRFPNAKGQAKRILNGLANQYNHAGAKNMLRQLN